jgi:hypothetical protein
MEKIENEGKQFDSLIDIKINLKSIKSEGKTLSEKLLNESKLTSSELASSVYLALAKHFENLESKNDDKTIDFLTCMSSSDVCHTHTYGCGSCGRGNKNYKQYTVCSNGDSLTECLSC